MLSPRSSVCSSMCSTTSDEIISLFRALDFPPFEARFLNLALRSTWASLP